MTLLSAAELRLAYTVMLGAGPAAAARKEADTTPDGRLDEAEARAIGERMRAEVTQGIALTIDGQKVTPAFEPATVGLAGNEVGPSPFSVDLVARIPCPAAGAHLVRLDDATPVQALGETEVRIEEAPGTRLLEAHRGPPADSGTLERLTQIVFRGPKLTSLEDRSITIRFEGTPTSVPQHPQVGPRAFSVVLLSAGVALLAVLALVWVARKRF